MFCRQAVGMWFCTWIQSMQGKKVAYALSRVYTDHDSEISLVEQAELFITVSSPIAPLLQQISEEVMQSSTL